MNNIWITLTASPSLTVDPYSRGAAQRLVLLQDPLYLVGQSSGRCAQDVLPSHSRQYQHDQHTCLEAGLPTNADILPNCPSFDQNICLNHERGLGEDCSGTIWKSRGGFVVNGAPREVPESTQ